MIYPCNRHPASGIPHLVSGVSGICISNPCISYLHFSGLPFRFVAAFFISAARPCPRYFSIQAWTPWSRGEQYRHHKFVNIVAGSGYQHLVQAPGDRPAGLYAFTNIEGNEKNHELSTSCETSVEPVARSQMLFSPVTFLMRVENKYIQHLPYQERDHGTDDDPHALPGIYPGMPHQVYRSCCQSKIFRREAQWPRWRWERRSWSGRWWGGKKFHAPGSYRAGSIHWWYRSSHKHHGPEQDPGSKVKTERATKKIDIGPLHPNGILEREYLYADHLAKQGAGDEDTGEQDKKFVLLSLRTLCIIVLFKKKWKYTCAQNIRILKIMIHQDSFTFTRKAVKIRTSKRNRAFTRDGPIASMTRVPSARAGAIPGQYYRAVLPCTSTYQSATATRETDITQDSKFGKKRMECRAV